MSVKIIPEPDIHVTQEEYERLYDAWINAMKYTTAPVSFEVWVRRQKGSEQVTT